MNLYRPVKYLGYYEQPDARILNDALCAGCIDVPVLRYVFQLRFQRNVFNAENLICSYCLTESNTACQCCYDLCHVYNLTLFCFYKNQFEIHTQIYNMEFDNDGDMIKKSMFSFNYFKRCLLHPNVQEAITLIFSKRWFEEYANPYLNLPRVLIALISGYIAAPGSVDYFAEDRAYEVVWTRVN